MIKTLGISRVYSCIKLTIKPRAQNNLVVIPVKPVGEPPLVEATASLERVAPQKKLLLEEL
jgi:hypothetical protein